MAVVVPPALLPGGVASVPWAQRGPPGLEGALSPELSLAATGVLRGVGVGGHGQPLPPETWRDRQRDAQHLPRGPAGSHTCKCPGWVASTLQAFSGTIFP